MTLSKSQTLDFSDLRIVAQELSLGGTEVPSPAVTTIETVTGATRTLDSSDFNKILDFSEACTVTVPDGLTSGFTGVPFSCGLSYGDGGGSVTVVAGVGGTVEAPDGFLVLDKEFGLMTLVEWPDGSFHLYGGTA